MGSRISWMRPDRASWRGSPPDHLAIALDHLIDHAGRGGDQVLVELALQALLHDFHVQQAQEAAAEAKAQRLRDFRLELQRASLS
jgi:hypothetical protein